MPDVICNTSPLQYLHQIGHLDLLPQLVGRVIVPSAVVNELAVGRAAGVALPDPTTMEWVVIQRPASEKALRLITDLGPGESEVLMLGLELPDSVLVLDDGLARRVAESLGLRLTGTLRSLARRQARGIDPRSRFAVRPVAGVAFPNCASHATGGFGSGR